MMNSISPINWRFASVSLLLFLTKLYLEQAKAEFVAKWDDKFIYHHSTPIDLRGATEICSALSGHLPVINTQDEIDNMKRFFNGKLPRIWLNNDTAHSEAMQFSFCQQRFSCCNLIFNGESMTYESCYTTSQFVCIVPNSSFSAVLVLSESQLASKFYNFNRVPCIHIQTLIEIVRNSTLDEQRTQFSEQMNQFMESLENTRFLAHVAIGCALSVAIFISIFGLAKIFNCNCKCRASSRTNQPPQAHELTKYCPVQPAETEQVSEEPENVTSAV